jgi:hypothetical protein
MNTEQYLSQNHYVRNFVNEVNEAIETYYKTNFPSLEIKKLEVSIGKKYVKLIHNNSVWGFISRYDGMLKGFPVKKGDLLKAASWNTPAAHSRGNIIEGTASYTTYGPNYLR